MREIRDEIRARVRPRRFAQFGATFGLKAHSGVRRCSGPRDPCDLVHAAFAISVTVQRIDGRPQLRIAVVEGKVEFKMDPEAAERMTLVGGTGLRSAARMEPLVKPGEIWVTENVKSALHANCPGFRAEPLGSSDVPGREWQGEEDPDLFNLDLH